MWQRVRSSAFVAVSVAALACFGGCGVFTARQQEFANAETGEDGQTYTLDDLRAIANDGTLSDAQRRQAFHDMGIEDEDLITALLALGPT